MDSEWSDMITSSKVMLAFLRNGFLVTILILLLCPTLSNANSVRKMIKFDVNQINFGCKATGQVNSMEVSSGIFARNSRKNEIFVTRFENFTIERFNEIKDKAGALLFMIPKDLKSLSDDLKENLLMLERALLFSEDVNINVYFSKYSETIEKIIDEISNNNAPISSAMSQIFAANQVTMNIAHSASNPQKNPKLPVISGELSIANKYPNQQSGTPVIIISSQIKSFGIIDELPPNHDTTVLLALMDSFSKLYSSLTSAPYRIVFMLSEGAYLLNFHGVKRWLDINTEANSLPVEFAINIDSFFEPSETIYMHVSKPPKEGSPVSKFFSILNKKAELHGGKTLEIVHKKINLADNFLKYGHEKFSIKKINAFSLSTLKNFDDELRTSVFSTHCSEAILTQDCELDNSLLTSIQTNTKILAESVADFVMTPEGDKDEIFTGPLSLTMKNSIKPYIYAASTSMSRSQNIKMAFEKHLRNVKVIEVKPDKNDPEFLLYEDVDAKLNIYNVKPAIFDLFMTLVICCYLFGVYFVILHFDKVYAAFRQLQPPQQNGVHHKSS